MTLRFHRQQRFRCGPPRVTVAGLTSAAALVGLLSAGAADPGYREAPNLANRVARGELPAVAARLPDRPMLIQPVERVGRYGGQWRMTFLSSGDFGLMYRATGYENLVAWDPRWTRIIPNVAYRWTVSPDATEYTFDLRPGLRWSDGEPFTSADIRFWLEDIAGNAELHPGGLSWLAVDGQPVRLETPTSHQVKFRFGGPHGLFLEQLATVLGREMTATPRHALTNYLPRYNPAADATARAAGYPGWQARYHAEADLNQALPFFPGRPTLHAWHHARRQPLGGDREQLIAERNPYYWKIDPAGNQLPYLDRVEFLTVPDVEALQAVVRAGDVDFQSHGLLDSTDRATIERERERNGYRTVALQYSYSNPLVISLNLTHPDPALRALFRDRRFREALSHALDRAELITNFFGGEVAPFQVAPRLESPFYHARLATQHLALDRARAGRLLDELGLQQRNADGHRLRPDGRPLQFQLLWNTGFGSDTTAVLQRICDHWRRLGITAAVHGLDGSEFNARVAGNRHDAAAWHGDGGYDAILEPRFYLPVHSRESHYAIAWANWFANPAGPLAEEPPFPVREQFRLYRQLLRTPSATAQADLMRRILDLAADEFYVFGVCVQPNGFGVVKQHLRNVPRTMPGAWTYPDPGPTNPCQYFWDLPPRSP